MGALQKASVHPGKLQGKSLLTQKKKKKSRTGNVPSGSVVCVARATASEYTRMLLVDRSDDAADYC